MKWRNPLNYLSQHRKQADQLAKETQQTIQDMQPVNIIVAGKTGSGKSTLINALFREQLAATGVGQPVTQSIQKISKEGMPLTLYDTRGLELTAQAQHEVLESLAQLIRDQRAQGPREAIHLVYYCLHAGMGRIEDYEMALIDSLADQVPVIVVLTQALSGPGSAFEDYLKDLDWPVAGVVSVLAQDYPLQDGHRLPSYGLQTLIDTSLARLPEDSRSAFINAQHIDLDRKVTEARRRAEHYIGMTFGVGFMPIPIADAAVLVPMQVSMLAQITAIFGVSLDKSQILSLLAGMGGTGGATFVGKYLVNQAFKLVPGLGSLGGGVISGVTASVLTVALALSYIEVLKHVALAERRGRDLPLRELQALMKGEFKGTYARLAQSLSGVKDPETFMASLQKIFKQAD